MNKVIKRFYYKEKSPESYYDSGDIFPKQGLKVSQSELDRLADLGYIEAEEEVPLYDDITAKEIKARLKDKGVEFNEKASKTELFKLLMEE